MLEGDPLRIRCIVATFFSIAFVTVCMRCYVRLRMVRCFGWDDAFMVLAMVSLSEKCQHGVVLELTWTQLIDIMFSTTAIAGTLHGFGRRFDELSPEETQTALKVWWSTWLAPF
jgi:cation-transporting ATPase 13A1